MTNVEWNFMCMESYREFQEIINKPEYHDFANYIENYGFVEIFSSVRNIAQKAFDKTVYEWLCINKHLYDKGLLEYDKIRKLQEVGFIKKGRQFSSKDLETYKDFISKIPEQTNSSLKGKAFEEQLIIVKEYIDKYYFAKRCPNITLDDYIQECLIGLLNGIEKYKEQKPKTPYKLFITRFISGHLANTIYKERQEGYVPSITPSLEDRLLDEDMNEAIIKLLQKLSTKQRTLIMEYFGYYSEPLNKSQLSIKYDTNRQNIDKAINDVMLRLRSIKNLVSVGLYEPKKVVESSSIANTILMENKCDDYFERLQIEKLVCEYIETGTCSDLETLLSFLETIELESIEESMLHLFIFIKNDIRAKLNVKSI